MSIPITFDDYSDDCPGIDLIPTFLPAVKRIIAIGDIHGDYELAKQSFMIAGLIKEVNGEFEWIANPIDTVVVQVGDQIDSCRPEPQKDCFAKLYDGDSADDMRVVDFFNDISKKAKAKGGIVYSLFGNHELMNAEGIFNYVSYRNFNDFEYTINGVHYHGPKGREDAFKPGGEVANMMACSRQSVIVIGSNMFAHAGVLPTLIGRLDKTNLDEYNKLKYINHVVRKWLLNRLSDKSHKRIISDTNLSPFWTRLFGEINPNATMDDSKCNDVVKKILQIYKLGSIIVGHTPQNTINGTCDDNGTKRVYRIDGMFSKAFDSFGKKDFIQVLEITDDTHFRIITGQKNKMK